MAKIILLKVSYRKGFIVTKEITKESPYFSRISLWAGQKFPAANTISGFFVYFTLIILSRYIADPMSVPLTLTDIWGGATVAGFFLFLRVCDEHKDYERDLVNTPDNALQKGIVTLKDLLPLGAVGFIMTGAWSLYIDNGIGIVSKFWAAMMVWCLLMAFEFFMKKFLEPKVVLYAFVHQIVSPFMIFWILSMGQNKLFTEINYLIVGMSFMGALIFELTRKTRGADEEKDTQDSYTKIWGINGCIGLIVLFTLIQNILFYLIYIRLFKFDPYSIFALIFGTILFFITLKDYKKNPTLKNRKKNEGGYGLLMMIIYWTFIIKVVVATKISWRAIL
jgi:hypothetical protein